MPSFRPHAKLSKAQVITIFQARTSASVATRLGADFGVSEKAIRDIWTGRTWSRETWHLDTTRPLQLRAIGRPKGCRDKKPRKKRINHREELSAPTQPRSLPFTDSRGDSFEPDALHILLDHHPNSAESASYFDDPVEVHLSRSAWLTSSSFLHASVDEQLYEWNEFWRSSASADPFCCDWKPQ